MDCLFNNVVISPHLPTSWHFSNPSLFGGISADISYFHHWQYSRITSHRCDIPKDEIEIYDRPCIYCGFLFHGYGHFILESLAMLWFIKMMPKDLPLVFSYSVKKEVADYQKDVLEKLGIDYRRVVIMNKITRFKQIYIPPAGYALGTYYLYEQQRALEICESHPQKGKRIYISRNKYNAKRGAVNEDVLESLLISRGWSIVYPEKLSFSQQIIEFASAETIFCVSGSALHSLVFLKNIQSKLVVIPRGHGVTYNMIVEAKDIKEYYLLDVPKENLTPNIKVEFDQSWKLDVGFIDKVLKETRDFSDIDLSVRYFKRPDKVNFNFRLLRTSMAYDVLEEDNILYKIMYYNNTNRSNLSRQFIYEMIARECMPEYGINKVYDIACKIDTKLALSVMEYVLSKFTYSEKYSLYVEKFIVLFAKLNKIDNESREQVYRKAGIYEISKRNYIPALRLIYLSLEHGGTIRNRGTIVELYNKIGLYDEAVKYAEETIQINDKLPWAYAHLAISLMNKKDFSNAYVNVNKAYAMNRNDKWVLGIKTNIERYMKK